MLATKRGYKNTMIGAIILGLVAGFVAKALMPGKDPGGFFVTILLGLAGALVGFFLFTELLGIGDDDMFDLGGLIGAIIGTMILLGDLPRRRGWRGSRVQDGHAGHALSREGAPRGGWAPSARRGRARGDGLYPCRA